MTFSGHPPNQTQRSTLRCAPYFFFSVDSSKTWHLLCGPPACRSLAPFSLHGCPLPRLPSLAVLPKSGSLLSPALGDFLSSSYHPRACPLPSVSSHRWTLSTRKAELMLSHPSSMLRAEPRAWHTCVQCVCRIAQLSLFRLVTHVRSIFSLS